MQSATEIIIENIKSDVFADSDLVNILPGSAHSRYARMKRAMAANEIIQVRKGLYCLAAKYQRRSLDLFSLAQRVYGPSYVSLESALSYHGWIPEAVYGVACVAIKKSRDFTTPFGLFSYRHIPLKPFYKYVERILTAEGNICFMAHPGKALADYVYIYKKNWRNPAPAVKSLRIDQEQLNRLTRQACDELSDCYASVRVRTFLAGVKKELAE